MLAQETFTGGVTPAAKPSDKHYKLNLTYKDKSGTFIGEHPFYTGNKPVLTLKEVDFRIRQTLIKNKNYIMVIIIKATLRLQVAATTIQ